MQIKISVPKELLYILNQVFEIEQKLPDGSSMKRNVSNIREKFEEMGFSYENPIGENYPETRTDCEASIAGVSHEDLVITQVLKPIIRLKKDGINTIVQKGIVIVEASEKHLKGK
jgi:hypothetical protein